MKNIRSGLLWAAAIRQFKLNLPLILAGLCSVAFLWAPGSATALTVVTTTADSGAGSLRAALNSEPANGQGNVTLTNGILPTEPARFFIIRAP